MTKIKPLLHAFMELTPTDKSFGLCNAPPSFQRCMMSIILDMIEKMMEVFMHDFSIYAKTFPECLKNLDNVVAGRILSSTGNNAISW
jgi:hypothetical protein